MTPSRPYLIRALYEWICDNACTPYLLVDAARDDLEAPMEYAESGRLVLNVAPRAVHGLVIGNEEVAFEARFGGVARRVRLPVEAVMAIYARENGQGMLFGDREEGDEPPPDGSEGAGPGRGGRPHLRVVK